MHKDSNNNFLVKELYKYYSLPELELGDVVPYGSSLHINFHSLRSHVICPNCGGKCSCRHSSYTRHLSDCPIFGKNALLHFHIHKYYCKEPSCPRKIVTETIPGEAFYSRRTSRLTEEIRGTLPPLSFREAGRQLHKRHILCSYSTCRRILYDDPALLSQGFKTSSIVGIDDFAYRKGTVYGSVVVDQSSHTPLDIISSRSSHNVTAWLNSHPGIQYVTRDGGLNFIKGISDAQGCITQIRDRFHLMYDFMGCLDRIVLRLLRDHKWQESDVQLDGGEVRRELWRHMFSTSTSVIQKKYERYVTYNEMKSKGYGIKDIALKLGTTVPNAYRHKHMQLRQNLPATQLPLFKHLDEVTEAIVGKKVCNEKGIASLFTDIPEETLTGLDDRLQKLREASLEKLKTSGQKRSKRPSKKEVFNTFFTQDHEPEHKILRSIMTQVKCRKLAIIAREFREMINGKSDACPLHIWMKKASQLGLKELDAFVKMIDKDKEAISNAIHIPFNNGLLEGTVCKIKAIKRCMYGKASFRLLKMKLLMYGST